MADVVYMTKERVRELEDELIILQTKGRREIAQKIADARAHGDLSENADYDAAKDEQGLLELKISKLNNILARVQVIRPDEFPNDKAYILSIVTLKNTKTGEKSKYQLVSAEEADFEQNKLGVSSPFGKCIMGKCIGDKVGFTVPGGTFEYEILEISK